MDTWIMPLLEALALPQYGLVTVFLVSLLSATLLPMASVPAVYSVVQLQPELWWQVLLVATAGNTLGGAISYWTGRVGVVAYERITHTDQHLRPPDPNAGSLRARAMGWLQHWGAAGCLLSWLPFIGDPLCAVAGWLRLPFWPCVAYMAVGKFLRYLVYVGALVWAFPNPFA